MDIERSELIWLAVATHRDRHRPPTYEPHDEDPDLMSEDVSPSALRVAHSEVAQLEQQLRGPESTGRPSTGMLDAGRIPQMTELILRLQEQLDEDSGDEIPSLLAADDLVKSLADPEILDAATMYLETLRGTAHEDGMLPVLIEALECLTEVRAAISGPETPDAPPEDVDPLRRGQEVTFWPADMSTLPVEPAEIDAVDAAMAARGLSRLGDARPEHHRTPGVVLRGYGAPDGPWGVLMATQTGETYIDFVTTFEDGSTLTTTTMPFVADLPDIQAYRQSRPGKTCGALYEEHCQGVAEREALGAQPAGHPGTFDALLAQIDAFMERYERGA